MISMTVESLKEAGIDDSVAQMLIGQMEQATQDAREEGMALMREKVEALTHRMQEMQEQMREREIEDLFEGCGLRDGVIREAIRARLKDAQTDAEAYLRELKEKEPMLFAGKAYPCFAGALENDAAGGVDEMPLHFLRMPRGRKAGDV